MPEFKDNLSKIALVSSILSNFLRPMKELTDEYAIFKVWPTEQDRVAATHFMDMPDLKWDKVEGGEYYMARAKYDLCNDQL